MDPAIDPVQLLFIWYFVLVFACLGFAAGRGGYGAGGNFTVAMAQQAYIPPETDELPLAGSVLLGVAGPALVANVVFWADYPVFAALSLCCFISTGLSMFVHSRHSRIVKRQRDWEIVEFLAGAPPMLAAHKVNRLKCPLWLHVWNGLNAAVFFALMFRAVIAVVALRRVS